MSLRERVNIVRNGADVALPAPELCENWADILRWRKLSKTEFMRVHGNTILREYDIPTSEEIQLIDAVASDNSAEEEDSDARAVDQQLRHSGSDTAPTASGSGARNA